MSKESENEETPSLTTNDLSSKENKPKIFAANFTREQLTDALVTRTSTLAQMTEQVKAEKGAVKKIESALMLLILADIKDGPGDDQADDGQEAATA